MYIFFHIVYAIIISETKKKYTGGSRMKLKEIDYDSMTDPLRRELYKSIWSDSNFDTAIKNTLQRYDIQKFIQL